jgi:hypothetical protein
MVRAVLTSTAQTGHTNFRTFTPLSGRTLGVGCSGSDPVWQDGGVQWIMQQVTGTTPLFDKSTIPGAPIFYHIDHPNPYGISGWEDCVDYEYLHLGDNPGLAGIHDPAYLNQWAQKMWAQGNNGQGGEVLLWTLQPYLFDRAIPALLAWIDNAELEYNRAQDYCNARMPGGKRLLRQIPGVQLFRRFFQDQRDGLAPSPNWMLDLYVDDFHFVRGKDSYIASIIGAACMYGIDPMVMPNDMQVPSGFTIAEAGYIKARVSQTVKAFNRSGVNTAAWL